MLDSSLNTGKVLGMETIPTTIQETQEVTAECLANCEELYDDWFDSDEPIDWWLFYDRLESMFGWSITQTDSPASKKIQRHVRKYKNQ
jgi:hypothetical protein